MNECLFKVSSETLTTLKDMGFTKMTEIQAKSIGPLLEVRRGDGVTGWRVCEILVSFLK